MARQYCETSAPQAANDSHVRDLLQLFLNNIRRLFHRYHDVFSLVIVIRNLTLRAFRVIDDVFCFRGVICCWYFGTRYS